MKVFCPFKECGRGFSTQSDLQKHLDRRHFTEEETETQELETQETQEESHMEQIKALLQTSNLREAKALELNGRKLEDNESLSEEFLLEVSGQDALEDVTELILRDKGLTQFESNDRVDLGQMLYLEYLSLSHNKLESIDSLAEFIGLQELNINSNLVTEISALEHLSQLKKLFCANNKIKSILPLKGLKQLTELSVYNNKLFDLETSLKILAEFPKLKSLEIDRNPCVLQTPNAKYKVIHRLNLDYLEMEPVSSFDIQMATSLFGSQTYVPKNLVGRLRTTTKLEEVKERETLYSEIKALQEELQKVNSEKKELELLRNQVGEEDSLREENKRLRREVASMYVLLDEVNELRNKLKEGIGPAATEVYEENARLKARIVELENKKKTQVSRPSTAVVRPLTSRREAECDESVDAFIQRNLGMLHSLDKKVKDFKKTLM